MNGTPYGFRIVGSCSGERRLIDWWAAFNAYAACDVRARCDAEAYLSSFTFGGNFRDHLTRTGSTKGYAGECGAAFLWWDIDRDGALDAARADAARLALTICDRFAVSRDDLLAFFSGAKGFHLGLPVSLTASADFHRITRRFCASVADAAGVVIDTGIYDAVRALRAPNSRHPKTGLYKRRLPVDALMHLDAAAIRELAKMPEPFDVPPAPGRSNGNLAADWSDATESIRREAANRRAATAEGAAGPTLNRLTLAFIRDGADTGDRHRLLFSAAANLAEFGCPPALAFALLEEPALDSGLPPKDVRRQIECGLAAVPSPSLPSLTRQNCAGATQTAPDGSNVKKPSARNTDDSRAVSGQVCQEMTETTGTPAELDAQGDVLAKLTALWGSAPSPVGVEGADGVPSGCAAGKHWWVDEAPEHGIRVVCRDCRKFYGYRPRDKR